MKRKVRYDERDYAVILSSQRLDAAESIFFAQELERVKTRTYDVQYPELTATRIIPVSNEAGPGAETITYHQYDQVGFAKIISNYATDLPRVDLVGKKFTSDVKSIGASYGYSVQDIRAARMAGKPLEQRKANAVRRANDQEVNRIAYFGDAKHGLVGLFTHPNVTIYTLPNDGTGSSTKWKDKTPDQVLRDMNGMANKPVQLTNGVETVDTLLLSYAVNSDINTRARSDTTDTTILEFFLKHNPQIKNVEVIPECAGAGTGGTDIVMMYKKHDDKLTLEIPQAFEQFTPQMEGLEFVVPTHSRCGGVIAYFPLSLIKAEGC